MNASSALFLDRDGVINVDKGYVGKIEDFEFIDGIFDFTRYANNQGYKVVVITNQSGIARGFYDEEQFSLLTHWMCQRFDDEGAPICKVYFSPYHPTEGKGKYLKDHYSRKPNPGMILQAQKELNLDLKRSILIGDQLSDIAAGNSAGVGKNLLFATEPSDPQSGLSFEYISKLSDAKPFLSK